MQNRRQHILSAGLALGAAWSGRQAFAADPGVEGAYRSLSEPPTALSDVTGYNNYYEFSTDKKAVKVLAQALTIKPWTVTVEGEVEKPFTLDADDLNRLFGQEERIYRLRCVEGWSMVVPWSGFPLSKLIERARPTSRARFVEFESLKRSSEMIGQRTGSLPWPYREGLRIDEATHPLALAVTGLYGQPLPKQNGAPLRIAIPWKYGFKSAKAITRIRLVYDQPVTSWNQASASEYGFFGNVNPQVAHPRWSQARENRVGELQKRPTLPFNGYAEWVADLYRGQDPKALF
jgi:sulfoxide reductase catalytic subunit YedY